MSSNKRKTNAATFVQHHTSISSTTTSSSTSSTNTRNSTPGDIPAMLCLKELVPYFNMKELARISPINTTFLSYWNDFLNLKQILVPLNVPTLRQAIQIGELFNGRSTYTTAEPLVIKLNRGLYDEGNGLHRLQFNLVLQGAGKQFTGIKNGIYIRGDNRNHLHTAFQVVLKDLTVGLALNERSRSCFSNGTETVGVSVYNRASFYAENVTICGSDSSGIEINNSRARLKNVEVLDNRSFGIQCKHRAIVTIEGTTKVYSNDRRGVNVDHLSLINLVQPLTKEKVFVNNGYDNQKNWLKEETNRFRKVARI